MRIKEGFELRNICGENIVVAHGLKNIDFTKLITLNESAALAWNAVKDKDFELQDIVRALLDEYEVDEATATADAETLVAQWKEAGLV